MEMKDPLKSTENDRKRVYSLTREGKSTLKHCLPIGSTLKDSLLQPFSKISLKTDSSLLRPINHVSKYKLTYGLQD